MHNYLKCKLICSMAGVNVSMRGLFLAQLSSEICLVQVTRGQSPLLLSDIWNLTPAESCTTQNQVITCCWGWNLHIRKTVANHNNHNNNNNNTKSAGLMDWIGLFPRGSCQVSVDVQTEACGSLSYRSPPPYWTYSITNHYLDLTPFQMS